MTPDKVSNEGDRERFGILLKNSIDEADGIFFVALAGGISTHALSLTTFAGISGK
jgi:hypothetical protein